MAQNRFIRNEELKIQNESLRSPSTGPNFKSSLPEEDKTSKFLNNFSICEQANMFFETRSSNSSESSYDGCHGSFNRHEMNGGELRGRKIPHFKIVLIPLIFCVAFAISLIVLKLFYCFLFETFENGNG